MRNAIFISTGFLVLTVGTGLTSGQCRPDDLPSAGVPNRTFLCRQEAKETFERLKLFAREMGAGTDYDKVEADDRRGRLIMQIANLPADQRTQEFSLTIETAPVSDLGTGLYVNLESREKADKRNWSETKPPAAAAGKLIQALRLYLAARTIHDVAARLDPNPSALPIAEAAAVIATTIAQWSCPTGSRVPGASTTTAAPATERLTMEYVEHINQHLERLLPMLNETQRPAANRLSETILADLQAKRRDLDIARAPRLVPLEMRILQEEKLIAGFEYWIRWAEGPWRPVNIVNNPVRILITPGLYFAEARQPLVVGLIRRSLERRIIAGGESAPVIAELLVR